MESKILCLYIQTELSTGMSLEDLLTHRLDLLSRARLFKIYSQILDGSSYVHKKGIVHRNLDTLSIFLDEQGDVKIGNFGFALLRDYNPLKIVLDSTQDRYQAFKKSGLQQTWPYTDASNIYTAPEQL